MHARSLTSAALIAAALSLPLAGCFVGPTNAWDDDTPPELQAKGLLEGAAAYPSVSGEAPRPPDGIKVSARRPGTDDSFEVTTSAANDGAFRFELPPGDWSLRAEHPAFAPATVGPLRVRPGETVSVDTLVLRLPVATSSLSGRVVAQGGLSAQGVEVSLLHDAGALGCGAVEAKVTTDESGAFVFDPVRPGRYVVVARTEGATLDVLSGDEAVEIENDQDAVLPRDLVIEPGTSVVEIEADGVFPASTSRAPAVVVHTRALAGMSEMQIGGDPTFDPSLGGTGWRPFQAESAFSLPPFEGEWTVFVQLRAGCVTSPLYAARVLFDPNPPEIVTAQAGTTLIDPLAPERPLAVVGAGQIGLPLTFTVIDESGVAAVRFHLEDDGVTSSQTVATTPQAGQSVVRATADIPVEEGRYTLTVELEDVAGNRTPLELSPVIDVLRDVSAPTTPLPTSARLEVAGTTAVIWLEERDCGGGTRAPVCEVNPHPDGLYRIRGGALADFAPFVAPPFEIPLGEAGATSTIEIVAVDAAGYTSPGAGFVEVRRHVPTTRFTAPINKELGAWRMPNASWNSFDGFIDRPPGEPARFYETPSLSATNGTAFFTLRARHDAIGPHFSYLIAQPAEAADVGTRWALSARPEAIRKLSYACSDYSCYDTYSRGAGGLGAASGALTWLERIGIGTSDSPQRPLRYVLHTDADGRYDVRGPETDLNTTYAFDHVDDPAPGYFDWERCKTRGRVRCVEDPFSWGPLQQPAPFATAFDGQHLVTAGASLYAQRFTGADEGQVTVTGPHVLAAVLEPTDGYALRGSPLIGALGMRIGLKQGDVVYGVFYQHEDDGEWGHGQGEANVVAHVAKGGGEELLLASNDLFPGTDAIAVGVFLPAGITATVPRVSLAPPGSPYRVVGMIDRSVLDGTQNAKLAGDAETYVDDDTRTLDVTLFLGERDAAGLGGTTGFTRLDLGDDAVPGVTVISPEELAAKPELADEMLAETHGQLATVVASPVTIATATDDAVHTVPERGCSMIVRPKRDVQVRSIALEGGGRLDQLGIRVWERGPATPMGRYEGAYVNPQSYWTTGEPFESTGPVDCYYAEPVELSNESATGVATVDDATSDTHTVTKATPVLVDSVTDSGVIPGYRELAYANLDAPTNEGWPVSPGDRILVTLSGDPAQDVDLYVRFNQRAGTPYGQYDCYSGSYGSDEYCELVAPANAQRVYVTIEAWDEDAVWNLEVAKAEPPLQQIASYPVEAGDVVRTTLSVIEGFADLYLRLNGEPSLTAYDCESDYAYSDDVCELTIESDGTLYVAVYEDDTPLDYDLTTTIVKPNVVEIATVAVSPSNLIEVEIESTSAAVARARFDDAGAWLPFECDTVIGAASCSIVVPGRATTATIGIVALEAETPFTAETTVTKVGCDRAQAGDPYYGGYTTSGVLREGRHYLITVGDGLNYSYNLAWPTARPAVRYGPIAPSNDYLEMLGVASTVTPTLIGGEAQIVDSIDAAGSTCRLELDVTPSVQVIRPALGDGQVAGVQRLQRVDGSIATTVIAAPLDAREVRQQRSPTAVQALPAGYEVAALAYHGEDLLWLSHDDQGRRAALWRSFAGVFPPGTPCEAHRFPASEEVASAAIDDGRVLVASQRAGKRTLSAYTVVSGGACPTLSLENSVVLDALPRALALDGNDAFLWRDRGDADGGALLYMSLRELAPLWTGASERLLGFDARGGDTALALYDEADARGRLVLVESDASTGALAGTRTLASDGPRWQPRFAGGALVSLRPSAPDAQQQRRPEVVIRPLAQADFTAYGETTLASAAAYFAGVDAYDVEDPGAWSQRVLLEAGGDNVVVLGQDDDGYRRLAIFRVPTSAAAYAGLTAEHEARLEGHGSEPRVERISVSDTLVVVTFADGGAPVILRRTTAAGTPTWEEHGAGTLEEERVLGVWDEQVLLMKYPGNLYVERPPLFVELFLRDPSTGLPLPGADVTPVARLPAELYARPLAFVGRGVGGALSLYDASAAEPILWRVDEHGFGVRDDGGHRPLTLGMEREGVAAAPRSSGEALYFLRRLDGGVSLMRYRPSP